MAFRTRVFPTLGLLLGLLLAALYLFANKPGGTLGFDGTLLDGRPALRVETVAPDGAAQRAGLRRGDVLTPPSGSFESRVPLLLLANVPLIAQGDALRFAVTRGNVTSNVTLVAKSNAANLAYEAVYFIALAIPMLILGWFVLWKRPESSDARLLGAMLLFFGVFIVVPDRVGAPFTRFVLYEVLGSASIILAVAIAALFFARYPEGRGLVRSRLRRVLLVVAIVDSVIELILMAASYVSPAYVGNIPWLIVPTIPIVAIPILAAFVCFIDAFRHGDATERLRLRWLGGSYFIGFSGPVLLPAATLALGPRFTIIDQALLESTLFILAFGLTYAVLRRRVVDVAFVFNRAIVFSVVSAIVVVIFIGVEWLVGLVFINISRPTSFVLEAGIAVVIGFSLRPIHDRVDGFIDRAFFAKRHAAERALHHLATEINFIRDREALIARVERDLAESLEVERVSIYFREDVRGDFMLLGARGNAPEFIDADDDAAVALTVEEEPVELHGRRTALLGELAVPLAIRKALVGILVLGDRVSQEAYAPDEIESLRFLANNLAPALGSHSAPAKGVTDGATNGATGESVLREILSELRLQREEFKTLNARLGVRDE